MKIFFKALISVVFVAAIPFCVFFAAKTDNDELLKGKSPHSGFCPDAPTPMKNFDGFENRPARRGTPQSN